jgi:hypothetical protein
VGAKLRIPEQDLPALRDLVQLAPEERTLILHLLQREQPGASLDELRQKVAEAAGLETDKIRRIVDLFLDLSAAREALDLSVAEFVEQLQDAMEATGKADLRPADWSEFRVAISASLSDGGILALTTLLQAIESSRELLNLPEDWDEAGSPPIEEATWRKATEFLKRHTGLLYAKYGIVLPTPRIAPGPDGSLDFHWKTGRRELLLNVPRGDEPASFYGDSYGTNSIKGQLDVRAFDPGLFTWLTITD